MKPNIGQEVKGLKVMTATELRDKYLEVFGEETRSWNKEFLLKRIAWRMQAVEEGDLSERARQRAEELANDANLRVRAPRQMPCRGAAAPERTVVRTFIPSEDKRLPMPGAVITREYQGETINVTVLDKGFEYEGKVYRTLTAVAKAVSGAHWNGYHFFGLGRKGARK